MLTIYLRVKTETKAVPETPPPSVSVPEGCVCGLSPVCLREGAQEELPRSMAHLSRGTALRPLYNLFPYGEGVPEELPEVMARLLRGSTLWARPDLFPCERVRRRSFLDPLRI